jgi:hypothetical protein
VALSHICARLGNAKREKNCCNCGNCCEDGDEGRDGGHYHNDGTSGNDSNGVGGRPDGPIITTATASGGGLDGPTTAIVTAAGGGPDAPIPAPPKRNIAHLREEEGRRQRDRATDPPEDVERVVRT